MRVDALAGEPHMADHLVPLMRALPDGLRGDVVCADPAIAGRAGGLAGPGDPGRACVVASARDLMRARARGYRRLCRMEHGAGQSYHGDRRSAGHPSYAGGRGHGDVSLFMAPGAWASSLWREAYPAARSVAVGSPRIDALPVRESSPGPVVCLSTHFDASIAPETRSALHHFAPAVPALRDDPRWTLIGHAHPRALTGPPRARRLFGVHGVPVVDDFADVCRRADLYICDNSSTIFEFAATGRPVVVLDAPWYRRGVSHGGRFWAWADVGVRVGSPDALADAVALALSDPPGVRAERARVLSEVYAVRSGSAAAAAAAIADWAA